MRRISSETLNRQSDEVDRQPLHLVGARQERTLSLVTGGHGRIWKCTNALRVCCAFLFSFLSCYPVHTRAAATRPHAIVQPIPLGETRWTSGFWADRFDVCHNRSIPAMWEIMKGTAYKPFYQHFLIAAGEMEGRFQGAQWNDGDFYKFLEGACAVWSQTKDPNLEVLIELSIGAIGRAQREDGYIHTPVLIRQRNGEVNVLPFQDRHNFEMYNMGHLLTAACLHHQVTGRDDFLSIAKRTADFLDETFRNPTPELARNSVCPSHYMGMIDLFRTTGESRYLRLAQTFLDMRNLAVEGGDDNQDRLPFLQQREAIGHAVRANYLYAGAADLWLETGDRNLWTPLEAIWENVVRQKMYITGACGALYDGASPYGSSQQSSITRVHQSYGHNYELPNTTAHGETCAAVGNVLWNWRMFLATGAAHYIDVLERTLYNAVLPGVSLEGSDYFYVNPLRNVDPPPMPLRWSRTRVPFVTSYCCPPNVLRTIAQTSGLAYSKTGESIWFNLYGSNKLSTTLNGQRLELTQETDYPWSGTVRVSVEQCPDVPFAIKLRIPEWAESAEVEVNGDPVQSVTEGGVYLDVHRLWKAGDVLQLELPMPAQLIEAHPLVEETRNQVALQRGPIVYCLESPDLPKGIQVEEIIVPREAKLVPRHEPDRLQGVTVIEADVLVRPEGHWEDRLYRSLSREPEQPLKVRFIPYYAWSNRGESEMSVWLPLR